MSKVLVIGDSCIDIFEYGKCKRICPEAPVPVLVPTNKKENGGMAANVYANLKSLGVQCDIVTNTSQPIKIRYIDETSNHMIVRVDRNDTVDPLDYKTLETINFSQYDAIVVSDYNKGFLENEQLYFISQSHSVTFLDTKKQMDEWCEDFEYIKINEMEYQKNWSYLNDHYKHNLIVTRGKEDTILNWHRIGKKKVFPIQNEHPVRDLTGAGDTFLAGLVANFIETYNISEAITFANRCAAWAVTQKGVAVVSMNNLKNNGYNK